MLSPCTLAILCTLPGTLLPPFSYVEALSLLILKNPRFFHSPPLPSHHDTPSPPPLPPLPFCPFCTVTFGHTFCTLASQELCFSHKCSFSSSLPGSHSLARFCLKSLPLCIFDSFVNPLAHLLLHMRPRPPPPAFSVLSGSLVSPPLIMFLHSMTWLHTASCLFYLNESSTTSFLLQTHLIPCALGL